MPVLISSFYPIRACIPVGRAGDGGLIQWRMTNKYFLGVYSNRNPMDALDLDIGFAMIKHFNKIFPHAQFHFTSLHSRTSLLLTCMTR